jgi:hypothetical protein
MILLSTGNAILKRVGHAALLSRHAPTCRRVTQSLGAAGLEVRAAPFPRDLPIDALADVAAVLVDLDVSPDEPPARLIAEARRAYPAVPLLVVAGVDARARLLAALCEPDVDHVLPKRGAANLPRGGVPVVRALEGPEEHDLFTAVRRLLEGPESPGVQPYLFADATVHAMAVRSSDDKQTALEEIFAFGESMQLSEEKLRRAELAAEELLMNALYDAPRDAAGAPRNAHLDRRRGVELAPGEEVQLRYACDGQTLAIAVADPFGSLSKAEVTARLATVAAGATRPSTGTAGAGLGLVMTYGVVNQLVFSVVPGRLTEVTAVLHVAGSNRAAQERGTAVHFYFGT